jgi:predicted transcriptional regulator
LLIDTGYTTKQIANEINISPSSVKLHLKKLNLRTVHWRPPLNIDRAVVEDLIKQHCSTREIATKFNCSQCAIKCRLKEWKLKTNPKWTIARKNIRIEIEDGYKTCSKCKQKKELNSSNFYMRKDGRFHYWCKRCNNFISHNRQKKMKRDAVAYKGGKCYICGYSKYVGSMDFHHVDPTRKDFAISSLRSYTWSIIQQELDKCILVCKNCHGEIHGKVVDPDGLEPSIKIL